MLHKNVDEKFTVRVGRNTVNTAFFSPNPENRKQTEQHAETEGEIGAP